MLNKKVKSRGIAAAKAGMDPKTARKYLRNGKLPSQIKSTHDWKTRKDPFEKDWPAILEMLDINPGLEGKTIFEYLQNATPGQYQDNQLRTLQRKLKYWRATEGPAKEVYFPGYMNQTLPHLVIQPGIRRKCHCLLLNRRINVHMPK